MITVGLEHLPIGRNFGYYLTYINRKTNTGYHIMDTTEPEDNAIIKNLISNDQRKTIFSIILELIPTVVKNEGYPDEIIRGPFTNNKLEKTRYKLVTKKFLELGYSVEQTTINNQIYLVHRKIDIKSIVSSVMVDKKHLFKLKREYALMKSIEWLGKNRKKLWENSAKHFVTGETRKNTDGTITWQVGNWSTIFYPKVAQID